jgi:5'-3' exonuclease
MGIRGVWSLFRRNFKIFDPLDLPGGDAGLRIGVDMFSLVYTHRAHLKDLLALLKSWAAHGHKITCVWDGVAPQEKKEIISMRREARESAMDKKEDLVEYLEKYGSQLSEADVKHLKTAITSLSWQGWHLTGSTRREIIADLGDGIQHEQATSEADDLLLSMIFEKKSVDVVMSLDSDLFAMGAPRIWRLLHMKGQWVLEDIHVADVCQDWGLTLGNLQDACFLAGWDRCHPDGKTYMNFESAVNRIKHYKSMVTVMEKFCDSETVEEKRLEGLHALKGEARARWRAYM